MINFNDFINEILEIDYSPNHQTVRCLISKVIDDETCVIVSRDFEKTGLLIGDIVSCRIDRIDAEYYFKARIIDARMEVEGLVLVIKPVSEVEEFFNLRSEKRINYRCIAFINEDTMATVINISKSGILLSTKVLYERGDNLKIKLLISPPHVVCNFYGTIVRIKTHPDGKKDYGIQITQFESSEDAKKYEKFVNAIEKDLEHGIIL